MDWRAQPVQIGRGLNRASVPKVPAEAAEQGRPRQVMKAHLCNSPASSNVPVHLKSPIFNALGKWLLKGASRKPSYNI